MNKTELIQAIADKTSLDTKIIQKVINACEVVLMENVPQAYMQSQDCENANSFNNNKNVKIVQFRSSVKAGHKTN